VTFHCNVNVGVDKKVDELLADTMTPCSIAAARRTRARPAFPALISIGVHDAMPYLVQQNKRVGGEDIQSSAWPSEPIVAAASMSWSSAAAIRLPTVSAPPFRQGAVRVTQLDIRPQPPEKEDKLAVWPYWATKMRTSSSQAEGAQREFQVATLEFIGEDGELTGVKCCEVDEKRKPIAGTEFVIRADLASSPSASPARLRAGWSKRAMAD
jgi:glutamate synthase (NADPH/NADH) small chain